jgi:hypothetical protein
MKPFVYIFASSLVICTLGGCTPRSGASNEGEMAETNESPAASLTAEEAAAYASYSPVLSQGGNDMTAVSEAASQ